MIISYKHRLLFIEVPLTASWAIHHELCNNYEGKPILHKHVTYSEFKWYASREELGYFAFAVVRNPLDKIVSRYSSSSMIRKGFSRTRIPFHRELWVIRI